MRLAADGTLRLSPSDLANHLACAHLSQLEVAVQRGGLVRPRRENPHAELIRQKGDEHEAAFLTQLIAEGRSVTTIELGDDSGFEDAARRTEEALRAGAEVVYQGVLASGGWRGIADFLVRVDEPSALGAFSYEAWDTKLARHAKPSAVLQLTFYSHELERIQGRLPERMHVVLGTGEHETIRPADFGAYFRHARLRLEHAVTAGAATYPYPVDHCKLCDFFPLCDARWDADDHLVRVANIRRDQIERLSVAGIPTLETLGDAPAGTTVDRMAAPTFETLRHQAALQLSQRRTGVHAYELLEAIEKRGLGLLPPPSPGDLFYDIEGDPWFEPGRGLEYLHGLMWQEGEGSDPWGLTPGRPRFQAIWAHDRDEERRALERLIDLFNERLAADPAMHVYHYASYEPSTLKRLVAEHATREEELDELLRREVFCDLYTVVRQSLRISYPSYSIKKVREFFMQAEAELGGEDAILLYERFLAERDPALLEAIERYNEEDCQSTLLLRDWLLARREEAEGCFGVAIPFREPPEVRVPKEEATELLEERAALRERLLATGDGTLALMAYLLEYHRREAKPVWWWFFGRLEMTPDELVEDSESIGSVSPDGSEPVPVTKKSVSAGFRFPVQQHRLGVGDSPTDPFTAKGAGEILELDDLNGTLRLKRGPVHDGSSPQALIPGGPYGTKEQQAALMRVGRSVVAGEGEASLAPTSGDAHEGDATPRRYPHLEKLLRREPPLGGARVQRGTLDERKRLVEEVEGSYLFVQGPPGSGKTWTGGHLIAHLLARGKRVGVASQSHKAIHKLLDCVVAAAAEDGIAFRGLKKATGDNEESFYRGSDLIENEEDGDAFGEADHGLFAGTGWLFAREELDGVLDYLFVDEAGQTSLADALALGTCARTIVLLGDPVQLAQVTQGVHPGGAGRSVLEHLLGERATVEEHMGLFLEHSYRMHPDVCRYISSAFYDDRLFSAPECAGQGSSFGTGIRWLPVEHTGNSTESAKEAARIRDQIEELLRGTWTDKHGVTRPLTPADVMVVAPYNRQVKLLTDRLPAGVAIGTVDKFQGQEAPVVFFSMASSSGADAPRGIDFLMSRNRLNVAVSRAQCLAYLACSPELLDVDAKTVEHMRLANALCRFVELAVDPAGHTS